MPNLPPKHARPRVGKPHKADQHAEAQQAAARQHKRLYATNAAPWRKLRAAQLAREPLCRTCANRGRLTAATEVDHINGDTANNAGDNLQSLCKPCHSRKTARESNGLRKLNPVDNSVDNLPLTCG
jgi:5-methylcytosine-specific restriction protein A